MCLCAFVCQDRRAGEGASPEDEDGPVHRGGVWAEGGEAGDESADPRPGGSGGLADAQNQGEGGATTPPPHPSTHTQTHTQTYQGGNVGE